MAKKTSARRKDSPAFSWRTFLKKVSREMLKDVRIREDLPKDVIESEWLGYEPASEAVIARLEKRLGKKLPPSYRTFLAETNGWRNCGPFIYRLWPCSKVEWFSKRNQDWIDAYVNPDDEPEPPERPISDAEYFVYGEKQNPGSYRDEYLQSALEISDCGDSAILLLNPHVVNEQGEWEAWMFANWKPGATRYRSFQELMEDEFESFCRLRKELGPSKSKYGNPGQQAAFRGETDKAIVLLRQQIAAGDEFSVISLAELCAFRGLWDEVITHLGRLIQNFGIVQDFEDYPRHLLHILGRAGHETGQWKRISDFAATAIQLEKDREYDEYHKWCQNMALARYEKLQAYCQRKGSPPHELARFVDLNPPDQRSEADRRAAYKEQMKNLAKQGIDASYGNFASYWLDCAKDCGLDDEIIKVHKKYPSKIDFKRAIVISHAYMRSGKPDKAWKVLEERINLSVGSLSVNVAPIILLVDETLRPLMTPERCEQILSTHRGYETWPKKK